MTDWIEKAKELGFDTAALFDPAILEAVPAVRDMCAADRCHAYNKNWTCPPVCGTIEECQRKMHTFPHGILLQTTGQLAKAIDTRAYRETEYRHLRNLLAFAEVIRKEYPDCLCLGAGACRVCKQCAYPKPCRFPEKAMSSMEAYGLFVTQVCRDCKTAYYYGAGTITYTACVLYG